MACIECERRRREMKIWAEAAKLWAEKPFGPNLKDIYARLWAAAKARGELDADPD
jgi:hypothetical protein